MKNFCIYILLATPFLFIGCKKDKEIGLEQTPKGDLFLRSIKVDGARKVAIDTTRNYIQIILPETFTSDIVDIELDVTPGSELVLNPWTPLYTPEHVKCYFKGLPPENFTILRKAQNRTKSYKVFIQHEGPLSAELTSNLDLYISGMNNAESVARIRMKSGLGSIPETPDVVEKLIPFLKNSSQNASAEGIFDDGLSTIYFDNIFSLMEVEGTVLSLEYGEKTFQFPQKLKLKRAPAVLYVVQPDLLFRVFQIGKRTAFDGGIFLDSQKYTLKLRNDPKSLNTTLPATVINISTLETQFPASLPDGQYKVEFFENTQLLKQAAIVIARDSTVKAIGQMWAGGTGIPWNEISNSQPVVITRGQELFANPFPGIVDASTLPFDDKKKVPDLALKINGKVTILKATVKGDPRYADNSIRIYYGAYRIPENLPTGRYEATMVTGTSQYSLPFWSMIEIR